MNIKIKKLIIYTISLIPIQKFKIFLYRNILGYEIDYSFKLGFFNLIYCKEFKLSENVKFGNFNKVTCLNGKVLISSNGIIKNNIIINGNGILSIDNDCVVNNNTYFDLAKNISIGKNVVFGGRNTELWTHGYDFNRNKLVGNIEISNNIYFGSGCIISLGVKISSNNIIGRNQ